jgi:hypothetical protein
MPRRKNIGETIHEQEFEISAEVFPAALKDLVRLLKRSTSSLDMFNAASALFAISRRPANRLILVDIPDALEVLVEAIGSN